MSGRHPLDHPFDPAEVAPRKKALRRELPAGGPFLDKKIAMVKDLYLRPGFSLERRDGDFRCEAAGKAALPEHFSAVTAGLRGSQTRPRA